MKNMLITIVIILSSIISYSQELKNIKTVPETINKNEKYIIGIGNNPQIYLNILDFLQKSTYVEVYKSCQLTQAIAVKVLNKEFKSYDEFLTYLKFEFGDLMIYQKDENIFTKECDTEIIKQEK